jgi:hypothetical protein
MWYSIPLGGEDMANKAKAKVVYEVPLRVTKAHEKVIVRRFEVARQFYNALLSEGLRRLYLIRESRAYQVAMAMPKGKQRNETLQHVRMLTP